MTRHISLMGLPKYKHNDIAATFDGTYGGVALRSITQGKTQGNWLVRVIQGDGHDWEFSDDGFA